jgi:hypothetical protein
MKVIYWFNWLLTAFPSLSLSMELPSSVFLQFCFTKKSTYIKKNLTTLHEILTNSENNKVQTTRFDCRDPSVPFLSWNHLLSPCPSGTFEINNVFLCMAHLQVLTWTKALQLSSPCPNLKLTPYLTSHKNNNLTL